MEQDWKPVVFKKNNKTEPKEHNEVSKEKKPEVFDDIKAVKYFTAEQGKKIASLRNEKKWTQEQLAQQLCIPKKTIVDLEQGKEKYNGPLVSKLKKVLGNFDW